MQKKQKEMFSELSVHKQRDINSSSFF